MCAQMGLVSQEPTLFASTIGANIAYGEPGATAADIETAAISANAHSFISALPHAYSLCSHVLVDPRLPTPTDIISVNRATEQRTMMYLLSPIEK